MKRKIAIIGAGHVGSHVARALSAGGVCEEIVLIDKLRQKAQAQAMDVADALSFPPADIVIREGDYQDCADADITVVAVGKARKPGQTRLDLLGDSVRMVHELAAGQLTAGVGGLMIVITNPCDIISDCLRGFLGMDRFRAFGTGTLLDTVRLVRVVSGQTGAARGSVSGYVLGEHGDSSMIPCSALRINGRPAMEAAGFDPESALERTRGIGMDIIEGKGSTEFGIGQAAAFLCRAILSDSRAVLPVSVHLEGEYGISGINCGVPCVIGRQGVESIVELSLTDAERQALAASAEVLSRHTRLAAQIAAGL